jgi:nucleoside-diphosphate-sugar epimerase
MVPPETRKVALRIGMVLANEEETVFDVLRKLTALGLGGTMGDGKQRISWIHMEDFLRAVEFVVKSPFIEGTINVTAPDFPTNREWMRIFRESVGMPLGLPASRWMLKIGARIMRTETELVLKAAGPSRCDCMTRASVGVGRRRWTRWRTCNRDEACKGFSGRRRVAVPGLGFGCQLRPGEYMVFPRRENPVFIPPSSH